MKTEDYVKSVEPNLEERKYHVHVGSKSILTALKKDI